MKKNKQIGVWMDHSNAIMAEISNGAVEYKSIVSEFTSEEKELSLKKNENLMHNKEQQQQSAYYKKITEFLRDFNEVILFGPTSAKNELMNLLKADHHFDSIKIEVKTADKMSSMQIHDFVKKYFSETNQT